MSEFPLSKGCGTLKGLQVLSTPQTARDSKRCSRVEGLRFVKHRVRGSQPHEAHVLWALAYHSSSVISSSIYVHVS